MPIIDIQRSIQEVGRIRTGEQVGTGRSKHPAKLEQFRLTSRDRDTMDECAALYGGEVREWTDAPGSGTQWELYTKASSIDVIVPPGDLAFTQWYELWNAGGCVRRCNGETQDYTTGGGDCLCNPEKRECKMTTRLSLFMANLNRLGLWRLESHGYYAAAELRGNVELLEQAAALGHMLPAALRLEQRTRKFLQGEKSQTRNYVVPVLDVRISALALLGLGSGGVPITALDAGMTTGALEPVPAALAPGPPPSVRDAVEEVEQPKGRRPRSNAAEPIPPTGRRRRKSTADAEVAAEQLALGDVPPEPDEPERDLTEWRMGLAGRLALLPKVVADQVKKEWPTLNFPTTLRKPAGWHEQNLTLCERFVSAAEKKANDLAKEARVRCGIKSGQLNYDDEERHALVLELVGKPGLTECTLDELVIVEQELDNREVIL